MTIFVLAAFAVAPMLIFFVVAPRDLFIWDLRSNNNKQSRKRTKVPRWRSTPPRVKRNHVKTKKQSRRKNTIFEVEIKIEKEVKEIVKKFDNATKNIIKTYVIVDDFDVVNPTLYFTNSRKAAIEVKKYFKRNYNNKVTIRPIVSDAIFCFDFGGINPDAIKAYNNYKKLLETEEDFEEKDFYNFSFSSVEDDDLPF